MITTRFASAETDKTTIRLTAVLTGLLYGLHPALIEPVAFTSSRFDLMATFFLLLALIADLGIPVKWARVTMVALGFLMAAFCKEIALSFPLMLPFLHFSMMRTKSRSLRSLIVQSWSHGNIAVYAGIVVSGVGYLFLRTNVVSTILDLDALPLDRTGSALQHMLLVGLSTFEYMRLTIFPFYAILPSHPVTLPVPISHLNAWLGLGLLTGLVAVSAALLRRRQNGGWLPIAVIACFLPILSLLPPARPTDAYFAESFLVFPIAVVLFAILPLTLKGLSSFQHSTRSSKNKLILLVIPLWLILSLLSNVTTLPLWRDDITLWSWAEKRAPHNMLVRNNLTNGYLLRKDYSQALFHAKRASEINPMSGIAWNNIGLAQTSLGYVSAGETAHRKAVSLNPIENRFQANLAGNLVMQKKLGEAEAIYRESLSIENKDTYVRIKLANLLAQQNRKTEAISEFQRALLEMPIGIEKKKLRSWLDLYRSRSY